ncbi:hypothetical protein MTO96_020652 [Rhipicephalus appendiculatus]
MGRVKCPCALPLPSRYATRHRNYWKNQGVPHEKLSLIFGPVKEILSKPRLDPLRNIMMFLAPRGALAYNPPRIKPGILNGEAAFFGQYSLDVIARCAFGTRIDSHTDATNEFVAQAAKALSPGLSWMFLIEGLMKFLSSLIDKGGDLDYLINVCQRIMKERRLNDHRQEDFLQLMMDAHDGSLASSDDGSVELEHKLFDAGSETKMTAPTGNKRLSQLEAIAQCVLFLMVGQETTSTTIAVTAYFLALHPDVQDKLRREVDECVATNGPEPSPDVVAKLKYLNCVVSEALRLFPAVASFSDDNVESIQPYSYLPFGAGPRNCIGMRFALQSVKLCLLHSLHSVEFFRSEKTKVPLTIKKGPGVLSAEEIIVGIRRRPERHD